MVAFGLELNITQHDVSTAHQEAKPCHDNDVHRFLATILADHDDWMESLETKWEIKQVQLNGRKGTWA